jgi:DNA-binding SARP family transcriptional activator
MATYRIELLGHPRFSPSDVELLPLPPRMALLIAYLAFEGTTTKERLGVLFWPESTSDRLRNNMRQLLHKLRKTVGKLYEEKNDTLWLADGCRVDAWGVREAFKKKDWAAVVAASPHFLGDCIEDGSLELHAWLEFRRSEFLRMHKEALAHEVLRLEGEGSTALALDLACQQLNLDPFSDDACRRVMRLQFQRGDRAAALQTYERFREVLRRDELGLGPERETTALAGEIRRSPVAALIARPPARRELPMSMLRPPLVGREREWAELEAAWQARTPIIYVCGEPGAGKSRLMTEFAHSKGPWFLCGARPGDSMLPYASRSRTIRSLLKACPMPDLEPWVRRELSRIVPELANANRPLPLPNPYDKPSFLEANYRLYERVGRRLAIAVYDDGQFIDQGTFEMGLYLEERCMPLIADGGFPPILVGLQPGQLQPDEEEILRQRVEKGLAAWIEVAPLSPESVKRMIAGMEVPRLERIAGEIAEYAGGTPAVVVETAKQILSQEGWDGAFPHDLRLPLNVQPQGLRRHG